MDGTRDRYLYPLIALGVFLYLLGFREAWVDDAFITFQYARTLVSSGTWGLYPGVVANTATSPLNTLLTAAVFGIAPHPVTALALAAVEFAVMALFLHRLSESLFGTRWFGTLSFVALLANPLLVSTLGLEGVLYATGMTALLWACSSRLPRVTGLVLGLMILTRPDAALWTPVLFWAGRTWRSRAAGFAVMILVLLPWHLWSWFALGSLVPDTLLLKAHESWPGWSFWNGPLMYIRHYPVSTVLSLVMLPATALGWKGASPRVRELRIALLLFVPLYYGAYALLGVPPYHWYYLPVVLSIVLLGALGAAQWAALRQPLALGLLALVALVPFLRARSITLEEPPIHTNWATYRQYRDIGRWLSMEVPKEEPIGLHGELGILAWYSERQLVDRLSDRTAMIPLVSARLDKGGPTASLLRWNFWNLAVPLRKDAPRYTLSPPGARPNDALGLEAVAGWEISSAWRPEGGTIRLWAKKDE